MDYLNVLPPFQRDDCLNQKVQIAPVVVSNQKQYRLHQKMPSHRSTSLRQPQWVPHKQVDILNLSF